MLTLFSVWSGKQNSLAVDAESKKASIIFIFTCGIEAKYFAGIGFPFISPALDTSPQVSEGTII